MNRLNKIISEIFEIDEDQIKDEFGSNNISKWDSLSQLSLISAIETDYKVTFEIEEIFRMMTIGDIRSVLENKLKQVGKI